MNSRQFISALSIVGITFGASIARAGAINITKGDMNTGSWVNGTLFTEGGTGWYKGGTSPQSEYQEVEPGMQTGANWDLAAFVNPTPTVLGILSGYDLATGGTTNTTLGDIFVTVNPPPGYYPDLSVPPPANTPYPHFTTNSTFNYNFAIHLDFVGLTYTVIALDANTVVENTEYFAPSYNAASNPYRVATTLTGTGYAGTGNLGSTFASGVMTYTDNLNNATADALAGYNTTAAYKYYATVGLGWLKDVPNLNLTDAEVMYKLTMSCGNDNMIGDQFVPDNAATLSLLGLGLLGLVGVAKWRARKAA